MATWRRKYLTWFGPIFVTLLYWLGLSLRIRGVGIENYEKATAPVILCTWHGRLFVSSFLMRDRGLSALISKSRDGDIISDLFLRLGFKPIRGSTGREGVRALVNAINALKEGATMTITPDGPRGPTQEVQDGILAMAQKSGAAIIPTSSSARWRLFAKSWDRFLIPLPFSPSVMVFGEPIYVQDIETARAQLKAAMDEVQGRADELGND